MIAVLLAAMLLGGCGGDDDNADGVFEHDGFPFTFQYPDGFDETDDLSVDVSLGSQAVSQTAVELDARDGLLIQRFDLNTAIDDTNLGLAQRELDRLISSVAPNASPQRINVGGLPALAYDHIPVRTVAGAESRLIAIFDANHEYLLNCQGTPAHRSEITAACDQAIDTLQLTD